MNQRSLLATRPSADAGSSVARRCPGEVSAYGPADLRPTAWGESLTARRWVPPNALREFRRERVRATATKGDSEPSAILVRIGSTSDRRVLNAWISLFTMRWLVHQSIGVEAGFSFRSWLGGSGALATMAAVAAASQGPLAGRRRIARRCVR